MDLTNHSEQFEYVVICSAAKMPNTCWGRYRHIAVMRVQVGHVAKQIRSCRTYKPVKTYRNLNVGKTARCAYEIALSDARAWAAEKTAQLAFVQVLTAFARAC